MSALTLDAFRLQCELDKEKCEHFKTRSELLDERMKNSMEREQKVRLKRDLEVLKVENERLQRVMVDRCIEGPEQVNYYLSQMSPIDKIYPGITNFINANENKKKADQLEIENHVLKADVNILKAALDSAKDKLRKTENGAVVLQDLLDAQRNQIDKLKAEVLVASKNGNIRESVRSQLNDKIRGLERDKEYLTETVKRLQREMPDKEDLSAVGRIFEFCRELAKTEPK